MFARVSTRAVRSVVTQSVRGNATRNVNANVVQKQRKFYKDPFDPVPVMLREPTDKFRVGFCIGCFFFGAIFIAKGWWNMANGTGKGRD